MVGVGGAFNPFQIWNRASDEHASPERSEGSLLARSQARFLPGPTGLAMVVSFSLCNNGKDPKASTKGLAQ